MTTVLEEPSVQTVTSAARRLRATTAAVRLSFTWFGTRKTLTTEQRALAADAFGAEGPYLSAGKKLLDTRHPAFKDVTGVKSRMVALWKAMSLPYPESGVRLIRQDHVEPLNEQMSQLRVELSDAVRKLDEHFAELKVAARDRLGSLYNPADYPDTLQGLFQAEWDFPSVEPPLYLQRLSPELYRQEAQRVASRFDEAVQLAEAAFLDELHKLVAHLAERLSGRQDGKPKIFRDSAVENLTEFFNRFRSLNLHSHEQLDELVEQCQRIISGVEPQALRDDQSLRTGVARELGAVQGALDALLVDRPRRNILRRPR